ncbi:hypothetical protein WA026_020670 [Henosepilachna vigintioctopunctata]|uniref:Uncharacterized protein n=1 Tax=Henosepilachna vigintioctopunctata TaxID=420089 RepID=A0AAW1UD37_9CUCU
MKMKNRQSNKSWNNTQKNLQPFIHLTNDQLALTKTMQMKRNLWEENPIEEKSESQVTSLTVVGISSNEIPIQLSESDRSGENKDGGTTESFMESELLTTQIFVNQPSVNEKEKSPVKLLFSKVSSGETHSPVDVYETNLEKVIGTRDLTSYSLKQSLKSEEPEFIGEKTSSHIGMAEVSSFIHQKSIDIPMKSDILAEIVEMGISVEDSSPHTFVETESSKNVKGLETNSQDKSSEQQEPAQMKEEARVESTTKFQLVEVRATVELPTKSELSTIAKTKELTPDSSAIKTPIQENINEKILSTFVEQSTKIQEQCYELPSVGDFRSQTESKSDETTNEQPVKTKLTIEVVEMRIGSEDLSPDTFVETESSKSVKAQETDSQDTPSEQKEPVQMKEEARVESTTKSHSASSIIFHLSNESEKIPHAQKELTTDSSAIKTPIQENINGKILSTLEQSTKIEEQYYELPSDGEFCFQIESKSDETTNEQPVQTKLTTEVVELKIGSEDLSPDTFVETESSKSVKALETDSHDTPSERKEPVQMKEEACVESTTKSQLAGGIIFHSSNEQEKIPQAQKDYKATVELPKKSELSTIAKTKDLTPDSFGIKTPIQQNINEQILSTSEYTTKMEEQCYEWHSDVDFRTQTELKSDGTITLDLGTNLEINASAQAFDKQPSVDEKQKSPVESLTTKVSSGGVQSPVDVYKTNLEKVIRTRDLTPEHLKKAPNTEEQIREQKKSITQQEAAVNADKHFVLSGHILPEYNENIAIVESEKSPSMDSNESNNASGEQSAFIEADEKSGTKLEFSTNTATGAYIDSTVEKQRTQKSSIEITGSPTSELHMNSEISITEDSCQKKPATTEENESHKQPSTELYTPIIRKPIDSPMAITSAQKEFAAKLQGLTKSELSTTIKADSPIGSSDIESNFSHPLIHECETFTESPPKAELPGGTQSSAVTFKERIDLSKGEKNTEESQNKSDSQNYTKEEKQVPTFVAQLSTLDKTEKKEEPATELKLTSISDPALRLADQLSSVCDETLSTEEVQFVSQLAETKETDLPIHKSCEKLASHEESEANFESHDQSEFSTVSVIDEVIEKSDPPKDEFLLEVFTQSKQSNSAKEHKSVTPSQTILESSPIHPLTSESPIPKIASYTVRSHPKTQMATTSEKEESVGSRGTEPSSRELYIPEKLAIETVKTNLLITPTDEYSSSFKGNASIDRSDKKPCLEENGIRAAGQSVLEIYNRSEIPSHSSEDKPVLIDSDETLLTMEQTNIVSPKKSQMEKEITFNASNDSSDVRIPVSEEVKGQLELLPQYGMTCKHTPPLIAPSLEKPSLREKDVTLLKSSASTTEYQSQQSEQLLQLHEREPIVELQTKLKLSPLETEAVIEFSNENIPSGHNDCEIITHCSTKIHTTSPLKITSASDAISDNVMEVELDTQKAQHNILDDDITSNIECDQFLEEDQALGNERPCSNLPLTLEKDDKERNIISTFAEFEVVEQNMKLLQHSPMKKSVESSETYVTQQGINLKQVHFPNNAVNHKHLDTKTNTGVEPSTSNEYPLEADTTTETEELVLIGVQENKTISTDENGSNQNKRFLAVKEQLIDDQNTEYNIPFEEKIDKRYHLGNDMANQRKKKRNPPKPTQIRTPKKITMYSQKRDDVEFLENYDFRAQNENSPQSCEISPGKVKASLLKEKVVNQSKPVRKLQKDIQKLSPKSSEAQPHSKTQVEKYRVKYSNKQNLPEKASKGYVVGSDPLIKTLRDDSILKKKIDTKSISCDTPKSQLTVTNVLKKQDMYSEKPEKQKLRNSLDFKASWSSNINEKSPKMSGSPKKQNFMTEKQLSINRKSILDKTNISFINVSKRHFEVTSHRPPSSDKNKTDETSKNRLVAFSTKKKDVSTDEWKVGSKNKCDSASYLEKSIFRTQVRNIKNVPSETRSAQKVSVQATEKSPRSKRPNISEPLKNTRSKDVSKVKIENVRQASPRQAPHVQASETISSYKLIQRNSARGNDYQKKSCIPKKPCESPEKHGETKSITFNEHSSNKSKVEHYKTISHNQLQSHINMKNIKHSDILMNDDSLEIVLTSTSEEVPIMDLNRVTNEIERSRPKHKYDRNRSNKFSTSSSTQKSNEETTDLKLNKPKQHRYMTSTLSRDTKLEKTPTISSKSNTKSVTRSFGKSSQVTKDDSSLSKKSRHNVSGNISRKSLKYDFNEVYKNRSSPSPTRLKKPVVIDSRKNDKNDKEKHAIKSIEFEKCVQFSEDDRSHSAIPTTYQELRYERIGSPISLPGSPQRTRSANGNNKQITSEVFSRTRDNSLSIEVVYRQPYENMKRVASTLRNETEYSLIDTTDSSLSESIALPSSPSDQDVSIDTNGKHKIVSPKPRKSLGSINESLHRISDLAECVDVFEMGKLNSDLDENGIAFTRKLVMAQYSDTEKEHSQDNAVSKVVITSQFSEETISPIMDVHVISPIRRKYQFDYEDVATCEKPSSGKTQVVFPETNAMSSTSMASEIESSTEVQSSGSR